MAGMKEYLINSLNRMELIRVAQNIGVTELPKDLTELRTSLVSNYSYSRLRKALG